MKTSALQHKLRIVMIADPQALTHHADEPLFVNVPVPLPDSLSKTGVEKGRDWFDFLWYISKKVGVNHFLLKEALNQSGPYKGKKIAYSPLWLKEALKEKIERIDWKVARRDVENFLRPAERKFVEIWGKELFLSQLAKMELD